MNKSYNSHMEVVYIESNTDCVNKYNSFISLYHSQLGIVHYFPILSYDTFISRESLVENREHFSLYSS